MSLSHWRALEVPHSVQLHWDTVVSWSSQSSREARGGQRTTQINIEDTAVDVTPPPKKKCKRPVPGAGFNLRLRGDFTRVSDFSAQVSKISRIL